MADGERLICAAAALLEGEGLRFELERHGARVAAFAVRHAGRCRAFVNECPHAHTELDWQPGQFFDSSGLYLMCATHGALFDPASGRCIYGPCRGRGLTPLEVVERGGNIFLIQG